MKNVISKVLAVSLNFMLVGSSFAELPGVGAAPKMPDFVQPFTPPSSLGYVTNYYKGQTEKPVILIQDLHANYGVQKKISGLLEFLKPQATSAGKPMIVGVEGTWGDLDLSMLKRQDLKKRELLSNFLLKEAEMSGMEYFAALASEPVRLVGIENPEDYIVHVNLFKKSLAARLKLADKLQILRSIVNEARGNAPRELKRLWRIEEDFHAGKIDLARMEKELNRSLPNYGAAEKALEEAKMVMANARPGDEGFYLRNVVISDHMISLLSRLLRQQLTLEEVQYAAKEIPGMLTVVRALLPKENLKLWEDTIRTAIDHYAVALVRDTPMAERAAQLAQSNPGASVVIVTGGFHTDGIEKQLQQKKISYVALAPVVESHTAKDERLYLMRMLDLRVTQGIFRDSSLKELAGTVQTVTEVTTLMANSHPNLAWSNAPGVLTLSSELIDKGYSIADIEKAYRARMGTPEMVQATALTQLVGTSEAVQVPGPVDKLRELFARFTRTEKIEPEQPEAGAKATDVALDARKDDTSGNAGKKALGIIGVVGVTALFSNAGVAEAAQSAASHPAVAAAARGDFSSAAVIAMAGIATVAVGTVAYKNKEKIKKIAATFFTQA